MAGYSPERSMQEFLRRGGQGRAGLDDLARRVSERRRELLQRHNLSGTLAGGEGAARPCRARGAQATGPRRRTGRPRARLRPDAPGEPAVVHRGGGERTQRLHVAVAPGPRGLREDQGPARPGAARPTLRRDEAGAGERHRRGPRGDQRHAHRPQRTAGQAPPRRGHQPRLRRLHGTNTATSSRSSRRTSTS